MESGRGKTRMNVQDDSRLSNLPEDLILKILSLVGTKLAVQTSALSSRWRYLWTSLPCLDFSSEDFNTLPKFSNFVTHVLSRRKACNNQINISSAKLSFHGKASQAFVTEIMNYVFSHNVKEPTVSCLSPDTEFPLSLFSSQSLEHLTIAGISYNSHVILTSTWELTSLTTLHLEYIEFSDEVTAKDTGIFSKCANLKKLVLRYCTVRRSNGVDICHPRLSDLTFEHGPSNKNVTNVVAPQLKNLTVRNWKGLHLISAPELVSLRFEGVLSQWLEFSSYEFSMENVDLCIHELRSYKPDKGDAHTVFDFLQQLHSVKYLTLNMEMFQLLAPVMDSYRPFPFINLKSLKVYPRDIFVSVQQTIPVEVQNYLLYGSPSATFTQVSYEEMKALKIAESALKCMTELGVMLEREKAYIDTNIAHSDQVMTRMECHEPNMHKQDKMEIDKWQMRDQINSCWKDLNARIEHGNTKTSDIISKLCHIDQLLTKLPASKRAQIDESFSRLCTEADVVMNAIMNSMKIQSNEKQSRLSIYFHELATKVLQTVPAEVQKYLLDGSPSATFTQVSCEEMKALKIAESALKCMTELGVMLEREKANIDTNIAHSDQVMSTMECHEPDMHEQDKMQIDKWQMRDQINSCWKDLSARIEHGNAKTCGIMTKLCHIDQLLTKLPATKRAQIEASFSKLCTEADIVMNAIMNSLKIQSDEKQSHLSIYFHEVVMAVKPSF